LPTDSSQPASGKSPYAIDSILNNENPDTETVIVRGRKEFFPEIEKKTVERKQTRSLVFERFGDKNASLASRTASADKHKSGHSHQPTSLHLNHSLHNSETPSSGWYRCSQKGRCFEGLFECWCGRKENALLRHWKWEKLGKMRAK
jgi:hypothetical protein